MSHRSRRASCRFRAGGSFRAGAAGGGERAAQGVWRWAHMTSLDIPAVKPDMCLKSSRMSTFCGDQRERAGGLTQKADPERVARKGPFGKGDPLRQRHHVDRGEGQSRRGEGGCREGEGARMPCLRCESMQVATAGGPGGVFYKEFSSRSWYETAQVCVALDQRHKMPQTGV